MTDLVYGINGEDYDVVIKSFFSESDDYCCSGALSNICDIEYELFDYDGNHCPDLEEKIMNTSIHKDIISKLEDVIIASHEVNDYE